MKSYCMNLNILRLYSNPLCIPVVKRISSISAFIHCKNYPRERELSCNILLPPSQQSATGPKSFFSLILQRQCVQIRAVYLQEHKWDNANISRHNLMSRVQAGLGWLFYSAIDYSKYVFIRFPSIFFFCQENGKSDNETVQKKLMFLLCTRLHLNL